MATILKCKMCGGDIEVSQDMTVGTCLYCGSTMTLPKIESEKKARLFNRANQYRLNCEFDKAYDAYRAIADEDEQEAEAYWGMLLAEYGIEYVEDPKSHKHVPTCHRTKVQAVCNSVNFKMACQYADPESKMLYQDEAEVIDTLQKDIISISAKEEDCDVFICYKESDGNGNRTEDSVLAETIYNELQKDGIRSFFARISLEDKIGENYEPYIFAALSSAKVMLAVTTNSTNLKSVWVRNEWSRYMNMMEDDPSKNLIPVYKDMSPYELPGEFSKLQAQDMTKIGAILDLVRGIKKLLGCETDAGKGGLRKADRKLLSDLEERIESSEKRRQYAKSRICGILLLCVLVFMMTISMTCTFIIPYTDSIIGINADTYRRFHNVILWLCLWGGGILIGAAGLCIDVIVAFRKSWVSILYYVAAVFLVLATLLIRIKTNWAVTLFYTGVGVSTMILILGFIKSVRAIKRKQKCRKIRAIFSTSMLLLFLVIIFAPAPRMSNPENLRGCDVIVIRAKYINIRESRKVSSDKIGEVYYNQQFQILSQETDETYTWYEIATDNNIHGYIGVEKTKAEKYADVESIFAEGEVTALVMVDEVNVRSEPSTGSDKIGKVYKDEKLDVYSREGEWLKICLESGEFGYVIENYAGETYLRIN